MKISIQWLKDYVPLGGSVERLVHKLTMAGLEVEKIESVGKDTVLECEITPNRPDCLNMLGIAREAAAILDKPMKTPKVIAPPPTSIASNISILDQEACRRYIGTVIRGVEVKESPDWIKKRLMSVGLRPINNIVDMTNFCLMETGQPLHAFDYDKLSGQKIVVRRARQGEIMQTLDDTERHLDPSMLVIADAQRPVAVAGVMGGADSEVTPATTNILLESAYFDPVLIRRTARKLGLSTDSSYRFERGVDMDMVEGGSNRAIGLILELAGGEIAQYKDQFPSRRKRAVRAITISWEQINHLLGAKLPVTRYKMILKKLGFAVEVKDRKILKVIPPSFRNDIKQAVDLIEECGRIIGYDNLPVSLPLIKASQIAEPQIRRVRRTTGQVLRAQGCYEIITYTLVNSLAVRDSRLQDLPAVRVKNPLTQEQELMRPDLLPSMLPVIRSNLNRGQDSLKLFELGKVYRPEGEKDVAALIVTGPQTGDWRRADKARLDFYDMKGLVSAVFEECGLKDVSYVLQPSPDLVDGQSVEIRSGRQVLGRMGKVRPDVMDTWGIRTKDLYFVQWELFPLAGPSLVEKKFQRPSEYPAIVRDVSLAVDKDVAYEDLKALSFQTAGKLLQDVRFVELYTGDRIPAGQRGLVFSLTYQSPQRTLTEDEVQQIHTKVCEAYVNQYQANIR